MAWKKITGRISTLGLLLLLLGGCAFAGTETGNTRPGAQLKETEETEAGAGGTETGVGALGAGRGFLFSAHKGRA